MHHNEARRLSEEIASRILAEADRDRLDAELAAVRAECERLRGERNAAEAECGEFAVLLDDLHETLREWIVYGFNPAQAQDERNKIWKLLDDEAAALAPPPGEGGGA
jgi:hypothetical protein